MASLAQLLVVSPDTTLLRVVQRCAKSLGHEPVAARSAVQARRTLARVQIDVLCLDSVLPPGDVEGLYEAFLAASNGVSPRVLLFGPPAAKLVSAALPPSLRGKIDGFVAKPIDTIDLSRELTRVLSGCTPVHRSDLLRVGGVALDGVTYQLLFSNGGVLSLTPMEYKLLRYLIERPGEYVATPDLLAHVWGYPADSAPELVRAHVSNLRKKLRKIGEDGLLRTMPYHGYAFVPSTSS